MKIHIILKQKLLCKTTLKQWMLHSILLGIGFCYYEISTVV